MRYILALFLLFSAVVIPLACGNQNNIPTVITASATKTFTATSTGTVFTNTPTKTPTGAATATPSPTPALAIPTPQHNYGTTASPNGMVISGSLITLAEYDSTDGPMVEGFQVDVANNGTADYPATLTNIAYQSFPTPGMTPAWAPSTMLFKGPQGFINPGGNTGYSAVLDTNGSAATLYYGSSTFPAPVNSYNAWSGASYNLGFAWEPYTASGFNIVGGFNSPKGLSADTAGYFYVADTGNGVVDQFDGAFPSGIYPLHSWSGNSGYSFPNVGGIPFTSVNFNKPYAVACDSNSPATVYVADNGYNPPVVEWFSSGGTTITGGFTTVSGGSIHGLAVGPAPNYYVYVADSGNSQVEVYSQTGNLLLTITDPHSAWEAQPFSPSCIGFDANGYIWIGDSLNRQIVSFK